MASFSSSVIASTSFCARHAGSRSCAIHGPFTAADAAAARDLAGAAGAITIEPIIARAAIASDQRRRLNSVIDLSSSRFAQADQAGGAQNAIATIRQQLMPSKDCRLVIFRTSGG